MVAFPKKPETKGGKDASEQSRDRIPERFSGELKDLIKAPLAAHVGGRAIYLEEHPTKANGYYTHDLLTLFGPIELSEAILLLYVSGVSTRRISRFLEAVYGAFYSPHSISRLAEVATEEVEQWRSRPLCSEYYAVYLDCTFLSVRRGKAAKEPVKWRWA